MNLHCTVFGLPHLGPHDNLWIEPHVQALIAIGSNATRRGIAQRLEGRLPKASVIYQAAAVSLTAQMEEDTVIFARAKVHAEAVIGRHAVLKIRCRPVEPDNLVGALFRVAPGAMIEGTGSSLVRAS